MFIFREGGYYQPQVNCNCQRSEKKSKCRDQKLLEWSHLLPFGFERPSKTGGTVSDLSLCIQRAKPVALQKGHTWDSGWSQRDGAGLSLSVLKPAQITGMGVTWN